MKNKEGIYFFLGGHDLEMLTIRDILKQEGVAFADYHLRWDNALLSRYHLQIQQLPETTTIIGVELQEDIQLPSNYHAIDHHNEKSHLPSALEQVVTLLDLRMNRYWELVAANDKAYIPGMMALNATKEEIEQIRRADRLAQGVTQQDEEMAEKALAENLQQIGDLILVHAYSSSFSPICDRLFPYKSLLIYTDKEWMYYGEGATLVKKLFEQEYEEGNLFYGAGENGYVGIKQNKYKREEIEKMVERIINNR